MWHTIYLYIKVKWTGTRTPSNQMHPARHMERFDESYEAYEQHQCHSEGDARELIRQTVVAYGGDNRTVQVLSVTERRF